jgi:hypothetical protein
MSKTFSTAKLGRELEVDGVNLTHGTEDQGNRIMIIAGAASGSDDGGELRLLTAADYDTTYNFYRLDAHQDDFRIGRAGQTDITLDSSGNTTFAGTVTGPTSDTLLIKDSGGSTLKTIRGV